MGLLCLVIYFIAFSVRFMFTLISFFCTSWNEIQHCYIGEGISAAVAQQLLLYSFFLFHLVWYRMRLSNGFGGMHKDSSLCWLGRLVHFHAPCRWGTSENGLWNGYWLQLLLMPECCCSWELAGIDILYKCIFNKIFVAIRLKFWFCRTIVLYNFILFFCNPLIF